MTMTKKPTPGYWWTIKKQRAFALLDELREIINGLEV